MGMSRFKELQVEERPREKAYRYGLSTLSDAELIALIIQKGSKKHDVLSLSRILLQHFGGLASLGRSSVEALYNEEGIGPGKGLALLAAFEIGKRSREYKDIETPINKARALIGNFNQESLAVLHYDQRERYVGGEVIARGTSSSLVFEVGEVMRSILRFHGKNFYLVHIHPSGNLLPSEDDILTTFSIKERGEGLGFFLLDHYILSEEESFSFKEHGFLTPFP